MHMHRRIETTKKGPIHIYGAANHDPCYGVVIFLHGWNLKGKKTEWYVDQAWKEFELQRKFILSGSPALFVAVATRDGKGRPVYWKDLDELLETIAAAVPGIATQYRVHVIGHSGAWANAVKWLASDRLDHLTLLDATYGGMNAFREWSLLGGRYLDVAVSTGTDTAKRSWQIFKNHPSYHVWRSVPMIDDTLDTCKTVFLTTRLAHMRWVTDDCFIPLFARRSFLIDIDVG